MNSRSEARIESAYKQKVEKQRLIGVRLSAAARFPMLKKALGSLPPTPAEIDSIIVNGLPEGFCDPPKTFTDPGRWGYRLGDNRRVE